MPEYVLHKRAASIVRDAGGELVGRTRLQKVVYLAQLAGFSNDFQFEYRHFGPFSEDLGEAIEIAVGLRLVEEEERHTDWGGWYSIYRTPPDSGQDVPEFDNDLPTDERRIQFIAEARAVNAIELELAATAAFLYSEEGVGKSDDRDPWEETRRRKPNKAEHGRLNRAKQAYSRLSQIAAPKSLPPIV